MSCKNSNMPIDINKTTNNCNLTCNFSYSYSESDLSVTNNTDYITFSYDGNSTVSFSGDNYTVQDIRLYKPSLNSYYGSKVDAELFIHHISVTGKNLLLCIPILENNASSKSNVMFNKIIPFIPSKNGENRTINVNNYTINNFIPKSGFYYYNGNLPYEPCNGNYDILLFDPKNAINMNSTDMNTVNSIIQPVNSNTKEIDNDNLYYNEKGTIENELSGEDEIYIDCQPVKDGVIDDGKGGSTKGNNKPMIELTAENLEIIGGVAGGIILVFLMISFARKVF